jgi:molybdopterin molybdotransferase
MRSVAEALKIIAEQTRPLPPEWTPLTPAASGLVLAEDVASDLEMPPFDKALMDGFAIRAEDLVDGVAELAIIEEVMAGQTPRKNLAKGQATRIMTGAPIPAGADAVVMIERCQMLESQRVRIADPKAKPGSSILPRGKEMRVGDVVLKRGARLRPQEFGILSTVGRSSAWVHPRPSVAILPTGDELVDATEKPGPGQIRNSNGPMILAQVVRAGGAPRLVGIAKDRVEHLRSLIEEGLNSDVLLLSGGVSAGKLDLVPGVLAECGVQTLFHQVSMKPGKPLLFGIRARDHGPWSPVFGLPGNPVSSLVCFELFVRPVLQGLMGLPPEPQMVQAILASDFAYRTERPTYHPAKLARSESGWQVEAIPWFGSADLRGLATSNAFVLLPPGDHQHRAGQTLSVLVVENEV